MSIANTYGLTEEEYQHILKQLQREPNHNEMGVFSAMWSEHCSYKHTRHLFKQFPVSSEYILQGPGENAGVVSIGDGWAAVFKVESHNHPSYVAPYDGAATGVGGLLRDIMAMGARPLGVRALLRSGPPDSKKTQQMMDEILRGAAAYETACSVGNLGTEWKSHPSYAGNPLVNVLCVGLVKTDRVMKGSAGSAGNLMFYYGRSTGNDGVAGAVFASKELDEQSEEVHPPAGDEKMGHELLEATLELIENDVLEGLQDMGAAGLTCSSFEMAGRAGLGFEMDLDRVPAEREGLSAFELLLSETQERMLASIKPENKEKACQIIASYPSLQCAVVGTITNDSMSRITYQGKQAAQLPVSLVTDGYLQFPLSPKPASSKNHETLNVQKDEHHTVTVKGSASPSQLQVSGESSISANCASIELCDIGKQLLLWTGANDVDIETNPYDSAKELVRQACDELRAAGAIPLGLTDGLNFGSPEQAGVAYTIDEAIRGLADGCREQNIAVVGGNVSLYNESQQGAIVGQVFIGVLGLKQ